MQTLKIRKEEKAKKSKEKKKNEANLQTQIICVSSNYLNRSVVRLCIFYLKRKVACKQEVSLQGDLIIELINTAVWIAGSHQSCPVTSLLNWTEKRKYNERLVS